MSVQITLPWVSMQTLADQGAPLSYAQAHGNYYIFTTVDTVEYTCVLSEDDAEPFVSSYKNTATRRN